MSDEIATWLAAQGLAEHTKAFAENAIDMRSVAALTDDDLKELGLKLGHRRLLQQAVAGLPGGDSPVVVEPGSQAESVSTAEAERRQLTVMFCDLVGSTALSGRYDPEDLSDIVRAYQDACAGVIGRYDGHIARFMGDGMLIYFGYPHAHEEDAERALHAGLAILDRVGRIKPRENLQLKTRIGVATGLVVVGETVGDASAREQVVMGETPNLAARLQAMAEPNQIIVADLTRRLAGEAFAYTDLGEATLKGFASKQKLWRVDGTRQSESRFEAHRLRARMPLVGRDQELELLLQRWQQARAGEGQMVVLDGEAGIGKSRITEAVMQAISSDDHVRVRYQCSPYHTDSPLYPAIQHLVRAASITPDDGNDAALDKLESMLADVSPESSNAASYLSALLGLYGEARYGKPTMTPQRQRAETLAALVRQQRLLSEHSPVLWVIEDMHWIDPTTLELIEASLDQTSTARIMILATARPTFEHGFGGHPVVTRLALNRLGRAQVGEIVTRLGGGKRLPASLVSRIAERTDGVPLFVEELTKTVLESGNLKETDQGFELLENFDRMEIPRSLHDSLMARLDRLKPLKEVAQTAACIGREFDRTLLARVSPLSESELDQALEGLVKAELVFRRGTRATNRYVFKHALVRDAAYESLLNARRRSLHDALFSALEDIADTPPEILAQHASHAGRIPEAIEYWQTAGNRALARPAYQEAIGHLQSAVKLTREVDDREWAHQQELALQTQISQAYIAHKGWAGNETDKAFDRALELVDMLEETPLHLPAIYGKFAAHYVRGEDTRSLVERFQALCPEDDAHGVRLVSWRMRVLERLRVGEFTSALELTRRTLDCYDSDQHGPLAYRYSHDARAAALVYGSWALWHLGYPEQAHANQRSALDWAAEFAHAGTSGLTQCWGGVFVEVLSRDVAGTKRQAEKSIELADNLEMPLWLGWSRVFMGWALSLEGDLSAGLEGIERGINELRENRCLMLMPMLLNLSAEAHALAGDFGTAHRAMDEAFDVLDRTRYPAWQAHLHIGRGTLCLQGDKPNPSQAEQQFIAAVEFARRQQARMLELRAAIHLATLWAERGKEEEALELLSPLAASFAEGIATPEMKAAKRLIRALS